jgi:hypothetical protein
MRSPVSRGLRTQCWLPPFLAVLLAMPPNLGAQQPAPQAPSPLATVQNLKVLPLSGNQVTNDLEKHVMATLVVQVLDENSRPVEGAQVVFRFPIQGPSAQFSNGQSSQTARTNADGQAAATGWTANSQVGTFQVHVNASLGNQLGEVTISMTNATRIVGGPDEKHKSWWSSKWAKIGVIAGAAGVVTAVVLATRGGSSGSSGTTVTASPGSPTIGGPH